VLKQNLENVCKNDVVCGFCKKVTGSLAVILCVVMIRNFFVLNVLEMVQCVHFAIGEIKKIELCVK